MKVVLITQCSDPQLWYAGLVGTWQAYEGTCSDGYWSREPSGYKNIINHMDAVVAEICDEPTC